MHVFHIRGLSGLALLIAVITLIMMMLTFVPATFMMIAWNAVVHEWFHGPAIALYQGFLLWGFGIIALKLWLQPEFRIEYKHGHQQAEPKSSPDSVPMIDESETAGE